MAPDDQAMRGTPGPLRLKGAKVTKKKKKKKDKASDAETSLTKRDTSAADDDGRAASNEAGEGDQEDTRGPVQKTEAEKRHEEIRRKRLLQLAEASGSKPELLKTHKERVEELNTYLSKLSEHHDMPKIGPG